MTSLELAKKRDQLVVKDTDLVQKARYKLTAIQQKFLAYLISLIKPDDPPDTEYTIRVEDFCEVTGIDKDHFYTRFKGMVNDFDTRGFWVWVEDLDMEYKFRWFSETCYWRGKGTVSIVLHRCLWDYLFRLKQHYTKYELFNVLVLRTKYAVRLFELLKSYAWQQSFDIPIEEFKLLLNAETYANYKDLRKRVLEPAVSEINEYTELAVSYDAHKGGRGGRVETLTFHVAQKQPLELAASYAKGRDRMDKAEGNVQGQMNIYDL